MSHMPRPQATTPAPRTCAACGAPAPPPFRAPAPELSPDLDLRPGEPARSTLPRWVCVCARCGAAGEDLSVLPASAVETVRTDAYAALGQAPAHARAFLRAAMIARADGDRAGAAEASLRAAWAADDAGDDAGAAGWRREAAAEWGEHGGEQGALRLLDVLRRAGDFAAAAARAAALEATSPDETTRRVAAFQRARAEAGDDRRHLLVSALRPPARTPHVAHGRAMAKPRFWQRLTGR